SWMAFQLQWDRTMARDGWNTLWWPKQFGGSAASPTQLALYEEEMARFGAPEGVARLGLRLVAPAIMRYGSPDQQARYLRNMLDVVDLWCQGYSEPNAGSDLASIRTRADREGDHYRINGSKIWTSYAQYCNRC